MPTQVQGAWAPPARIDEFTLERRLGAGGFGQVWLARDTLLERPVALKIASGQTSAESRIRFRTEARAVARLAHPNLVKIHHVGEIQERPFLVTELLAGESLDRLPLPLEVDSALTIGIDLARGLAAAHRAGVLHRDIKPANAIRCDDGTTKLLDFGLARLADGPIDLAETVAAEGPPDASGALGATQAAVTYTGRTAGTPSYMAPETWRGEPPTEGTDVYSLGVLLFELLAGQPPCAGVSVQELKAKVVAGAVEALEARAPTVPSALADLVMRCLRLDPADRPTAQALGDALQVLGSPAATEDPATEPDANPYRGLLAFDAEHAGVFFGREVETAAVVAELRAHPLAVVVGPSGAGKSSLVRAGVVPRVEASDGRRALVLLPGSRPLEALARAIAGRLDVPEADALAGLTGSAEWLGRQLLTRGWRVLLVVDQLEELWTLAPAPEREAFCAVLAALTATGPAVRIVATLRSDFLSRLDELGEVRAEAFGAMAMLGPLGADGLRRAILEPARRRGVTLEPALVERLVEGAHPGSLPLLEFALSALWERRDVASRRVTLQDLEGAGGLEGALAAHADAALAALGEGARAEARRLLLALVAVEGTRARREEDELAGPGAAAREVLAALVRARLLVASVGDTSTAYEIAHEAIVSGWPTLRGWLEEEAADRALGARVTRGAVDWQRLGQGADGLLGVRQVEELERLDVARLPALERSFVESSRRAVLRARRRRWRLALGAPLAVLALGVAAFTVATSARRAALARELGEARTLDAAAAEQARQAASLRARALERFERDELEPAEDLWRQTLAAEEAADGLRQRAGVAVERALGVDPAGSAARVLAADLVMARLEAAERLHRDALRAELLARLALYDDGSRAAALVADARLTVQVDPPDAVLSLGRYSQEPDGVMVETDVPLAGAEPDGSRRLAPGSCVLRATLAGRYPTRQPLRVGPGERRTVHVVLPDLGSIPENFVYVPSGASLYGSAEDETTRRTLLLHQPLHEVTLPAFLVARTETTYAAYLGYLATLTDAERRAHSPEGLSTAGGTGATLDLGHGALGESQPYCSPPLPCTSWQKLPVVGVSRADAEAYAAWLARGAVPGARLCTDREWERAARGADARRFPNGDRAPGPDDACTLATFGRDSRRAGPCAVGTHPATRSPFEIDDLTGSVWEWVAGSADAARPAQGLVRGAGWGEFDTFLWLVNRGVVDATLRTRVTGIRICANAP